MRCGTDTCAGRCAGYFPDITDSVADGMNYEEQLKQIDICALGPLRVSEALHKAGKVRGSIVIISSQAGSAEWRTTQNANEGGDYGHHMSRAACNIGGVLLAEELKKFGIAVLMLHPGFNRTGMTSKYSHIWDVEGAVDASVGAKRVLHEVKGATMDRTGLFIVRMRPQPAPQPVPHAPRTPHVPHGRAPPRRAARCVCRGRLLTLC